MHAHSPARARRSRVHPSCSLLAVLALAFALGIAAHARQTPAPTAAPSPTPAAPPAAVTTTPLAEDQRLIEARVAREQEQEKRERAQRELFEEQVKVLRRDESSGLFATAVASPFTPLLTTIIGALFAVFTYAQTQRASRRAQRNTDFFEALKNFGDRDSPTLRASAAGTLAHMGREKHSEYGWRRQPPFLAVRRFNPHLDTALDQLAIGLQLESDPNVLSSIKNNLARLIEFDQLRAIKRLHASNLELQNQLAEALSEFYACRVGADLYIGDEHREQAGAVAGMRAETLRIFQRRHDISRRLQSDVEIFLKKDDDKQWEVVEAARDRLAVASERLKFNVELYAKALQKGDPFAGLRGDYDFNRPATDHGYDSWERPTEMRLEGSFLSGAYLGLAKLQGVNLESAQLDSAHLLLADLRRADLKRTHLEQADLIWADLRGTSFSAAALVETKLSTQGSGDEPHFDKETDFSNTYWWKANLNNFGGDGIDSQLLKFLYSNYGDKVPDDLSKVHESVRVFIEATRGSTAGTPDSPPEERAAGSPPDEAPPPRSPPDA